jgi:hypothetical protein
MTQREISGAARLPVRIRRWGCERLVKIDSIYIVYDLSNASDGEASIEVCGIKSTLTIDTMFE